MFESRTPEQALSQILEDLKKELIYDPVNRIIPAGSVALGTYVDEPDIDIFIETPKKSQVMRGLQRMYPKGHEKAGELTIWASECYGYSVDFVIIEEGEEKTQTLKHVEYFKERLTPEKIEMIKKLKRIFKNINCYSAETGGVTGICLTTLAMNYDTIEDILTDMINDIVKGREFFVEDPTLKGRNLFACVVDFKRKLIVERLMYYNIDMENITAYRYNKQLMIRRLPSVGIDREFQKVHTIITKQWNLMKNQLKWWAVNLDYDIWFSVDFIYVQFTLTPNMLSKNDIKNEIIKKEVLNDRAVEALRMLSSVTEEETTFIYAHKPPFLNLELEFRKRLVEELGKIYIDIDCHY